MTTSSTVAPKTRRRWPVPQFSLGAALFAMTLCAVGLWYWYRVPFEVVHEQVRYDFSHDPLDFGDEHLVKQTEVVHRTWGGKTVRNGWLATYKNDHCIAKEEFREDVRHGAYRRWHEDGMALVEGQFERGLPQGHWVYHLDFDQRLPPATQRKWVKQPSGKMARSGEKIPFGGGFPLGREQQPLPKISRGRCQAQYDRGLPDGEWEWVDPDENVYLKITFDKGRFIKADPSFHNPAIGELLTFSGVEADRDRIGMLRPVNAHYVDVPLVAMVEVLAERTKTRFALDARRLEESGVNIDTRVSCRFDNLPLAFALEKMVQPLPLAIHYRYSLVTVTAKESLTAWQDPTHVSRIVLPPGSTLERVWNQPVKADFVETPLKEACKFLSQSVGVDPAFDFSQVHLDNFELLPVTHSLSGLTYKDALASMLDHIGCQARLEGETIVVELQENNSSPRTTESTTDR